MDVSQGLTTEAQRGGTENRGDTQSQDAIRTRVLGYKGLPLPGLIGTPHLSASRLRMNKPWTIGSSSYR